MRGMHIGLQVRACVIFVAEKRLQQLFIGVAAAFFVVAISVQIAPFLFPIQSERWVCRAMAIYL